MKYVILSRQNDIILAKSQNDYIVGVGYDETQPIGQQWNHGLYFSRTINGLCAAIETFRSKTEEDYISRDRIEELATKFKDCAIGDEDITEVIADMSENEIYFFGLNEIEEDDE